MNFLSKLIEVFNPPKTVTQEAVVDKDPNAYSNWPLYKKRFYGQHEGITNYTCDFNTMKWYPTRTTIPAMEIKDNQLVYKEGWPKSMEYFMSLESDR